MLGMLSDLPQVPQRGLAAQPLFIPLNNVGRKGQGWASGEVEERSYFPSSVLCDPEQLV